MTGGLHTGPDVDKPVWFGKISPTLGLSGSSWVSLVSFFANFGRRTVTVFSPLRRRRESLPAIF